jgi:type III secretion protein S
MKEAYILHYTVQATLLTLLLSMPPIIVATITGLLVSLLQALTQVQEQTLSFGVKLFVTIVVLLLSIFWMGEELVRFTMQIFEGFPILTRVRG